MPNLGLEPVLVGLLVALNHLLVPGSLLMILAIDRGLAKARLVSIDSGNLLRT